MLFLAQINFSEASGLGDFPEAGLLQIFLSADERGDAPIGEGDSEDVRMIRWFDNPQGGAVLPVPEVFTSPRSHSPLRGAARDRGVAPRLEPDILPPTPYMFPIFEIEPDIHNRLAADAEVQALMDGW